MSPTVTDVGRSVYSLTSRGLIWSLQRRRPFVFLTEMFILYQERTPGAYSGEVVSSEGGEETCVGVDPIRPGEFHTTTVSSPSSRWRKDPDGFLKGSEMEVSSGTETDVHNI